MPPRDLLAYLEDIRQAIERIRRYTADTSDAEAYRDDLKTREAVERCFQIIGEGLTELKRRDPKRFEQITHGDAVIRFRNLLVHAYFNLDAATVWSTIRHDLDLLQEEVSMIDADIDR